jgi:hypothetical protein
VFVYIGELVETVIVGFCQKHERGGEEEHHIEQHEVAGVLIPGVPVNIEHEYLQITFREGNRPQVEPFFLSVLA